MDEHGEDIELDLLRFWQLDLVEDLGTPRLTWRRLGLCIDRLITRMPESLLAQSAIAPGDRPWMDLNNQLLAVLADRFAVSNWLQGQALTARGVYKTNPVPEPKPIPRPGVTEEPVSGKGKGLKAVIRTMFPAQAAKAGI